MGDLDLARPLVLADDEQARRATGRGVSTDVVEAAARAYLSAVNRLSALKAREEPGPLAGSVR